MDKIIVFTANIGEYDSVSIPTFKDPNVRYILFTDNKNFKSNFWEVVYLDKTVESTKLARFVKIMCYNFLPPHVWSIWFDCSFDIRMISGEKMIKDNLRNAEVMCYKHPVRDCTYEEAVACQQLNVEKEEILKDQLLRYRKEGFPKKAGLFATGIMIRKNTKKVRSFCDFWWKEIENGSKRDQISQIYASWKTKTKISSITKGISVYSNPYSSKRKHIKPREVIQNKGSMIYFFTPYSFEKNLGKAYNQYCDLVPNDSDWICIMDGDMMFVNDFGSIIQAHITKRPDTGLFLCLTNRVKNTQQCYNGEISENSDLGYHAQIAKHLEVNKKLQVKEMNRVASGYLMCFKKETWKVVGKFYEKGILAVDNKFSKAILDNGLKIRIMEDLYAIHYYRLLQGIKDKSHLR
jgi:hypothetical protein